MVCWTSCARAAGATSTAKSRAPKIDFRSMVPFWTRLPRIWLSPREFLQFLQSRPQARSRSRELQIEGLAGPFVEGELRRVLRRALQPRGIAPFALRHVFDRNREIRSGRQLRDLELSLLIGTRRAHPAAVAGGPLLRIVGEDDDGVFLDGLAFAAGDRAA